MQIICGKFVTKTPWTYPIIFYSIASIHILLSSSFIRLVAPNKKSFYCKIPKWISWSVIEIIKNEIIYGFGQVIVFFLYLKEYY